MTWLFSMIFGGLTKLVPGLTDSIFKHLENKANSETERIRIATAAQQNLTAEQASTIRTAMGFRVFWVAWSMIAIPFAAWLGWGFMDSLFNGALPDVAALPKQLKGYGDIVIANIFVSGAGVAGIQSGAATIREALTRRQSAPVVEATVVAPASRRRVKDYHLPKGK